jgi:UDP-N-acetylglucosamine 4-epimerase
MSNDSKLAEALGSRQRTWLVTGAAGFIGSHLAETLLQHGQKVVGLDNFATGKQSNIDHVMDSVGSANSRNYHFITGDIRHPEDCRAACQGVDLVLHQAALGSVPRSLANPAETNSANIDGFLNMLVAARDAGVARFVYAASSSTYGDQAALEAKP